MRCVWRHALLLRSPIADPHTELYCFSVAVECQREDWEHHHLKCGHQEDESSEHESQDASFHAPEENAHVVRKPQYVCSSRVMSDVPVPYGESAQSQASAGTYGAQIRFPADSSLASQNMRHFLRSNSTAWETGSFPVPGVSAQQFVQQPIAGIDELSVKMLSTMHSSHKDQAELYVEWGEIAHRAANLGECQQTIITFLLLSLKSLNVHMQSLRDYEFMMRDDPEDTIDDEPHEAKGEHLFASTHLTCPMQEIFTYLQPVMKMKMTHLMRALLSHVMN